MEKFNCAYDELVDVDKLVPNPKNNNKHPEEQIERLAKIIDFQGQRKAIVVSNRSGFIVKGHGCLEAIKLLGWKQVAVDYQDYDSEAQEYADMTADNEIARWATLDTQMVLDELPNLDIDTDLLGMMEIPEIEDKIELNEDNKEEKENNYRITYELCFNDEIEQEHWFTFLKVLKNKFPEVETISERIIAITDEWVRNNEE